MFRNVLLSFSLLCGFLLPNHINAFATQIPAVYSWETEDSDASAIVMPPLPSGYTTGTIISVATDADGNAVMVGYAYSAAGLAAGLADVPLAYSLAYGETAATSITLPTLPDGYTQGKLWSVAINGTGQAIMGGWEKKDDGSAQIPLAYSWTTGDAEATPITFPSDLPDGFPTPNLWSVAIDAAGNAVMVGTAQVPVGGSFLFRPIAYRLNKEKTRAEKITLPDLPVEKLYGELSSVAINAGGNAVIVGAAFNRAGTADVPLAYSLAFEANTAEKITLPAVPTEYTGAGLDSVAINDNGNAVMVGEANKGDFPGYIPLAYSWTTGIAKEITPDLTADYPQGKLYSVAINAAGNAVMGGSAQKADFTAQISLAYGLAFEATEATPITSLDMPAGYTRGSLESVAIDTAGNAVMGGGAYNADATAYTPLAYSLNNGETDASAIETPPLYHEYPLGYLNSVAITSDGKAIMGGYSTFVAPNTGGAFQAGDFTQPPLQ